MSELPVHPSSPVRKWPVAHLQQCSGVNHLQAYCVAIGLGTKWVQPPLFYEVLIIIIILRNKGIGDFEIPIYQAFTKLI